MPAPSILPYDAATFLWFTEPLLLAENRSDSVRFSEFTCSIFELEGEVGEARAGARLALVFSVMLSMLWLILDWTWPYLLVFYRPFIN
jgi:hypothetical protein